ncbi:hypothetical protein ALC56_05839 [Trachymyrmex septentrionalis]|uniref:Protein shisa-4 n=1 Tax=Trachymyrmex septentrionalis TaxID=34720 RepID=A0A151JXC5_9HYME|nr:PREDICTED: uncharacterized protein LOC108748152 [Trachymyrmex septentrionalis]KYN39794.1 hypothetical protein ALC56_05839 [Trachymyrmex septentrionalis]
MSHLKEALLLICLFAGYVHGGLIDCNFEILERNIFDHWATTCPRIFDPKENNYCCVDIENKRSYCCTLLEFAKTTGVTLILPVAAGVIGIIFLVICCISCFCCGCCPWYRRPQGPGFA